MHWTVAKRYMKIYEAYLIENYKQRGTNTKVIKSYIQCTLLNIVNTVPTNVQVQLEQFANFISKQAQFFNWHATIMEIN